MKKLSKLNAFCGSSLDVLYLESLSNMLAMFNPTVGDSISIMLCVEACLRMMKKGVLFLSELFTPLEFIYGKSLVKDKLMFVCNDNETKLLEPIELQGYIDNKVNKIEKEELCRCFVRPSGTEDIVRVYVEGRSKDKIEGVLKDVMEYISKKYS